MTLNSNWITYLIGSFFLYLCLFQIIIYIVAVIYSYINVNNSNSGDETDIDSGNESDFEDEIPKAPDYSPRREIMPGARLRMMRR